MELMILEGTSGFYQIIIEPVIRRTYLQKQGEAYQGSYSVIEQKEEGSQCM